MSLQHFEIIAHLEKLAPPPLKESYDNIGCLVGDSQDICTGVMIGFDCTSSLVQESIAKKCNLIITHHPLIFGGIKKITSHPFPDAVIKLLIKNDITHYAIHTNIDNITKGVNKSFSTTFQLTDTQALLPKSNILEKLIYFAPTHSVASINKAIQPFGVQQIETYKAQNVQPLKTAYYTPSLDAQQFDTKDITTHETLEMRVELLIPTWARKDILHTLAKVHPHKQINYDIIPTDNIHPQWGSGIIGSLPQSLTKVDFLQILRNTYKTPSIRHTHNTQNIKIKRVAFCGGSGASFIKNALVQKADAYVTGDLKYHDFLDGAQTNLLLVDIGHYESEYSIISLLYQVISSKFPNFAIFKEAQQASPIGHY